MNQCPVCSVVQAFGSPLPCGLCAFERAAPIRFPAYIRAKLAREELNRLMASRGAAPEQRSRTIAINGLPVSVTREELARLRGELSLGGSMEVELAPEHPPKLAGWTPEDDAAFRRWMGTS